MQSDYKNFILNWYSRYHFLILCQFFSLFYAISNISETNSYDCYIMKLQTTCGCTYCYPNTLGNLWNSYLEECWKFCSQISLQCSVLPMGASDTWVNWIIRVLMRTDLFPWELYEQYLPSGAWMSLSWMCVQAPSTQLVTEINLSLSHFLISLFLTY